LLKSSDLSGSVLLDTEPEQTSSLHGARQPRLLPDFPHWLARIFSGGCVLDCSWPSATSDICYVLLYLGELYLELAMKIWTSS
jgi:hypothetical protein